MTDEDDRTKSEIARSIREKTGRLDSDDSTHFNKHELEQVEYRLNELDESANYYRDSYQHARRGRKHWKRRCSQLKSHRFYFAAVAAIEAGFIAANHLFHIL